MFVEIHTLFVNLTQLKYMYILLCGSPAVSRPTFVDCDDVDRDQRLADGRD